MPSAGGIIDVAIVSGDSEAARARLAVTARLGIASIVECVCGRSDSEPYDLSCMGICIVVR
jgi:hypothetical protein